MWQALREEFDYVRPRRGDIRTGVVVRVDDNQLVVDIGAKTEGIVQAQDLAKLDPEFREQLQVGTEVPVYVLRSETRDGDVLLSINMARVIQDWNQATELQESGEIIEVEIIGHNRGGLIASFGELQGFVPRSHIVNLKGQSGSARQPGKLSEMVGTRMPVKVIEVNRRQRRLILSERSARREWRAVQKKRLLESLEAGMVVRGTVSNLADFGAFVDLGGADGLIHVSELSWDRVRHPREVLKVGQEVEVYVLRVDRERKRIGLSLRQLRPDPWTKVDEEYYVGQLVQGTITNVTDFGAFAWIEEGIEGLIHISELSDVNIAHPRNVVSRGDVLTMQIISINAEKRRMGLSLRRVPKPLRREREEREVQEAEAQEIMEAAAAMEAPKAEAASPAVEEATAAAEMPEVETPPPVVEEPATAAEMPEPQAASLAVEEATAAVETPPPAVEKAVAAVGIPEVETPASTVEEAVAADVPETEAPPLTVEEATALAEAPEVEAPSPVVEESTVPSGVLTTEEEEIAPQASEPVETDVEGTATTESMTADTVATVASSRSGETPFRTTATDLPSASEKSAEGVEPGAAGDVEAVSDEDKAGLVKDEVHVKTAHTGELAEEVG